METIKVGDAFKNWRNDIHVVNRISKTSNDNVDAKK